MHFRLGQFISLLIETCLLLHSFYTFKKKYHLIEKFYLKEFLILSYLITFLIFDKSQFFNYCTLHILVKALFFLYLSFQLLGFYFPHFFYSSNNNIALFYESIKSLINCWSLIIFISSFVPSYSLITLFTKQNLLYEPSKALKIKTFMVFNLVFVSNTILSSFFLFL